MSKLILFDGLYAQIRDILQAARQRSYRAVNVAMIEAYWQIGRQIVEHEQAGEHRAAYGQRVLVELAKELSKEFGKGFTAGNLRNFRQFNFKYLILSTPWRDLRCSPLQLVRFPSLKKGARGDL